MVDTWLTADWHMSDASIIKYCEQPFTSEIQHDRHLIREYKKVVKPEDTIYFVGDISIRERRYKEWYRSIFEKLPGTKHLILGNHDYLPPFDYVYAGFASVHTALDIGEFIIVHDPAIAAIDINRKFICGHVHRLFKKCNNVVNVGVDVWDFKPVNIDTIRELFDSNVCFIDIKI